MAVATERCSRAAECRATIVLAQAASIGGVRKSSTYRMSNRAVRIRAPGRGAGMRRREFIAAIGATAIWPRSAHAQKPAMPVIGLLHEGKPFLPATSAALEAGLREFGLI